MIPFKQRHGVFSYYWRIATVNQGFFAPCIYLICLALLMADTFSPGRITASDTSVFRSEFLCRDQSWTVLVRKTVKGLWPLSLFIVAVEQIKARRWQRNMFLLLFALPAFAQHKVETLSVFNGLANPQIYAIAKDRQGFMWFGSADGVKRFNGYEFHTFRHDPDDAYSLSNNSVGVMLIDSSDQLWVGTWGGGVNRFERDAQSFIRYQNDSTQANSLSADRVQALFESAAGEIWVGTNGGGLNRYNASKDNFTAWQHDPDNRNSLAHDRVWSIAEDHSNTLWIGTSNGLNQFDPVAQTFNHFAPSEQGLDHPEVRTVHLDNEQRIWVATRLSFGQFEPASGEYTTYNLPGGNLPSITSITQVEGSLLLATFAGVYTFDLQQKRFVPAGEEQQWGLLENRDVRQVMQDSTGILWAATRYSGVIKVYQNATPFEGWRNILAEYPLSGLFNQVVSLHQENTGEIWLGTGRSLVKFDGAGQFAPHMNTASLNNLNRLRVLNFAQSQSGETYLATDNGLYQWQGDMSRIERIVIPQLQPGRQSLDWVTVSSDTLSSDNEFWLLLSGDDRIVRWSPVNNSLRYYLDNVDPAFIFQTQPDEIWVGTVGDGLFNIKTTSHAVKQFHQGDGSGLSDNTLNAALKGENGEFWVATRKGVDRYNPATQQFEHFAIQRENLDIAVQSLVMDRQDYLWLATNQGIFKLEPADGTLHHFTVNDGLHSNNFLARSALMAKDGSIYFGSIDGLTRFQPEEVYVNRVPPPVVITGLTLDGRVISPVPETLEVSHHFKQIQIHYAALDYQAPEDNRYRTRVTGYSDDWSPVSPATRLSLGRLQPGEYQLQIQGSNNHGVWSDTPATLHIVVHPAWYQSLWFLTLFPLTLIIIMLLAYRYKMQQHARVQRYLSAQIEERTQDILVLGDVGRDLARTFDASTIAQTIFEKLRSGIDCNTFALGMVNREAGFLEFIYAQCNGQDSSGTRFSLQEKDLASVWSANHGQSLALQNDRQWQAHSLDRSKCLNGHATQSVICEPLLTHDGVLGVITLQSEVCDAFSHAHLSMLRVVASHASVALQNTIAFGELEAAQKRLALAMEGANAGMWELDLSNNKLIVSEIWARMLGYEPDELNSRFGSSPEKFMELLHPDDKQRATASIAEHLEGKSDTYRAEFRLLNKHNEWQWTLSIGQAVRDAKSGKALHMFGIHLDVSDARQLQAALEEARDKAEQATQAKSDFLSNMSHEIRTPMNAIIGMSHLALQTELNRKQHNYISKVHSSAESLLRIINDILDFSKIEAGKMDIEHLPFDLEDVLHNLANVMGFKAAEKQIDFYFSIAPGTPTMLIGDAFRLGQVLLNLGNNAVKFTELHGEIVIRVAVQQDRDDAVLLRFDVQDNGIGMTDEQKQRLFQSFSQADSTITRKYGGTGLGLAICKDLVTLMGGEIWVESAPGVGSTFSCTVHCGKDLNATVAVQHPLQQCHILLLDASTASLQVMMDMLLPMGAQVTAIKDVTELDRVLAESAALPELVIMKTDNHGEVVNQWLQRTAALHHRDWQPKVILLLPFAQDDAKNTGDLVISAVLNKPLTPSVLFNTLQEVMQQGVREFARHQQNSEKDVDWRKLNGTRILLVEDNALNQELATELLTQKGVVVTLAEEGQSAIDLLAVQSFDVVLMDCQMPVLDGYSATRLIRQNISEGLPVIAMTANAMAGDREKALAAGMNDHIAKPIEPNQMYSTIAKWLPAAVATDGDSKVLSPEVTTVSAPLNNEIALSHLDLQKGLNTCANNPSLYIKLLQGFSEQQPVFQAAWATAQESQQQEEMVRLAHTLKGNAGNIGAMKLYAIAGQLEQLCSHHPEQVMDTLPRLQQALADLNQEIPQAITELMANLPDDVAEPPPSDADISSEASGPLLELLETQVKESDTAAEDTLEQLLPLLPEHRTLLESALQALDEFDFDRVESLLEQLKSSQ